MCECVSVCVCVCACVCARVRAWVGGDECECVCVYVCVWGGGVACVCVYVCVVLHSLLIPIRKPIQHRSSGSVLHFTPTVNTNIGSRCFFL